MIGIISNKKIFEFKDEVDLGTALEKYGEEYGCSVIIIVDRSNKIRAVLIRGVWEFMPKIDIGERYYIYGCREASSISDLSKFNTLELEVDYEISKHSFVYDVFAAPTNLNQYLTSN